MFCRSCLANYNKESCPSCLEPLDKTSFQLSKFVKRQISRLRARCIYHSLGCPWEGLLEDCHSQSVSWKSTICPIKWNEFINCVIFVFYSVITKAFIVQTLIEVALNLSSFWIWINIVHNASTNS